MTSYSATSRHPVVSQTLGAGDALYVLAGRVASAVIVDSGARAHVPSGGSATSTTVDTGGVASNTSARTYDGKPWLSGGRAYDTVLSFGGTLALYRSGPLASGTQADFVVHHTGFDQIFATPKSLSDCNVTI